MSTLTNNNNTETISSIYIGPNPAISNRINNLMDNKLNFRCENNFITALLELQDEKKKYEVIFCDSEIQGTNPIEYKLMIDQHKTTYKAFIILCNKLPDKSFLEAAYNTKVDDILYLSENSQKLHSRINTVLKANNAGIKSPKSTRKNVKAGIAKRAFDIAFSSLALLILSPILLVVALLIKLDSKGPIIFISKRVGTGYKLFDFYKFRSMKSGADSMIDKMKNLNQYSNGNKSIESKVCPKCEELGGPCSPVLVIDNKTMCENFYLSSKKNDSSFIKIKDDPRVTKLGRFIRKTSIDELPQLINILKGDMSFVGNRPLPVYEAECLTTDEYAKRFLAPAGLTGLWQVSKRGKSSMSEDERKQLDNTYASKHSFLGDIILLLKTIPAVTQKENV